MNMQVRQTKIIVTLGPATDDPQVLSDMLAAGANVCRINMSHGSAEEQLTRARQVREVAPETGREVAILVDLQGPKIRIRSFAEGSVTLARGDRFILDASPEPGPGDRHRVGVTYAGLPGDVSRGDMLLLDDGLITMEVVEVGEDQVVCAVVEGGVLASRKGVNLKGGGLSIPGITEQDREDIRRAAKMGADYVAVSFPRNADDMREAADLLRAAGSEARLVAKIERVEAVDNLDEIIATSHAVLVARGDLGVEIGDAELPGLQKHIIRRSLEENRIVITATQMMQSMVENPIPTRAEVLDVANAVIDGTDAVMLSAETAVGRHPVAVVKAMHRVCMGAERHVETLGDFRKVNVHFQRIDQAIASAAMFLSTNVHVDAIIAMTESGSTAQWLSRVRTSVPIFGMSPLAESRRLMALYRGVHPIPHLPKGRKMEKVARNALGMLLDEGKIRPGDRVLLTMGERLGKEGGTNTMRLVQVDEDGHLQSQARLEL